MILLTGATGNNGAETAHQLVALGAKVRAMALHPDKTRAQIPPGVEIVPGDLDAPETFGPALFGGIEKVFLLSPADARLAQRESSFVAAAKQSGVKHIVKFSVLGASEDAAFAFGRWHGTSERAVVDSGLAYTFLRPTVFMQNLLWSSASIKAENAFSLPLAEARIGVVDTRDIATVAARVLTGEGHAGRAYDLTGPQALTYSEIAHVFSHVLGRRIEYRPNIASERRRELLAQRMPESYVDAELDLAEALIAGIGNKVSTAVEEITGVRPRDVATFARDFAPAFGRGEDHAL